MSADQDALAVVNQLKDLSADPLNRRAIVQDQGCLPGLILFLDHPDPQVVYTALLALQYLAECRVNRDRLKTELGMLVSLQNVLHKSTTPGETKLLASQVLELLQEAGSEEAEPSGGPVSSRRRARFFMGSSNKRAKTVVLHVDGLDDSGRRGQCEEALLKVRGVISFTFQMASKRCVVRIRSDLKPEALASAIAATQVLTARQVLKTDTGDEVLVPLALEGSPEAEQNTQLPDYLPEDEGPDQAPDRAVTYVSSGQGGASWLGATANFLSQSFYW